MTHALELRCDDALAAVAWWDILRKGRRIYGIHATPVDHGHKT